jgi:hypothetical protein
MPLKPADIVLARSKGPLGWAIRLFERGDGKDKAVANHTGVMYDETTIIEALNKVLHRPLLEGYGPPNKTEIAIFRSVHLTPEQCDIIAQKAHEYQGDSYGYLKIAAHALDRILGGAYLFRRIACMDKYPICSWVVAQAYSKVGEHFGVAPGAAEPEDIWDYVHQNPDKYVCVWPLARWH